MADVLAVVQDPGLATVQDSGRRGWAAVGVPTSGAWHRWRHDACVRLVEGSGGSTIELLAGRLALRVVQRTMIAVVGPAAVQVRARPVPTGASIEVAAGDDVVVEHRGPGPVYLAIAGWTPPRVLGSTCTDTFSGLGGGALVRGDELRGSATRDGAAGAFLRDEGTVDAALRVMVVDDGSWMAGPWRVTSSARSGTRLRGGHVESTGALPSMPVVVGAVQATPDGELIVLGPDGGLTGGYPVVAVVISADLDAVSTRSLGDVVRFAAVSVQEADAAHRALQESRARAVVRPDGLGQAGGVVPD